MCAHSTTQSNRAEQSRAEHNRSESAQASVSNQELSSLIEIGFRWIYSPVCATARTNTRLLSKTKRTYLMSTLYSCTIDKQNTNISNDLNFMMFVLVLFILKRWERGMWFLCVWMSFNLEKRDPILWHFYAQLIDDAFWFQWVRQICWFFIRKMVGTDQIKKMKLML